MSFGLKTNFTAMLKFILDSKLRRFLVVRILQLLLHRCRCIRGTRTTRCLYYINIKRASRPHETGRLAVGTRPTGALKNRKMPVKYSSSRLYKQSVMDARKDPYQVHKWRIKSGRMLDKNFLPRPVAKNETKSLRVSLPPLPSKTLSKKRPFLKVAKSFQGRSLETVLEEKERFLVGNRGLREENRDKGQSNETPTILTRLRNRMKLASEVEISQAATSRLEDEENRGRCEIQSGFSDFSTPERMIPPRVAPLNQMQPISKANSIARQKIQRENRDEIRRSSNFVLPPIATSGRRKSYPMRRASNVMEPSRARGKRSQPTKFSQKKNIKP